MRKTYLLLLAACCAMSVKAQLTGTKNIPGDFATLSTAISELNFQGVGAGGVTLNLVAGNPQTAPAGGYAITATGTAANPITIQGNGNIITASASLTAGSLNDAIFKLIGADFVTLTGFTMQENAANTTIAAATNNMTEFGIALLHTSVTDGAQNNTISSNTISLNRTYTNSFGIYCNVRHSATNVTTLEDITNNTTAPNSNNKVYTNNISNVNLPLVFFGSATGANMDLGNDIGGTSTATGNNITNWGGTAAPATAFVGLSGATVLIGAFILNQNNYNLSFNTFVSASLNITTGIRGILATYDANPTGTITNNINTNTLTIAQAGSGALQVITSAGAGILTSVTQNNNNNIITGCSVTSAAATLFGVANLGVYGTLNMNGNIISGNTSTATTGGFIAVTNQGAVVNTINILNNEIGTEASGAVTFSAATTAGSNAILNTVGTATTTLNITGNFVRGFSCVSAGTISMISNSGTIGTAINILNNEIGTETKGAVTFSAATAAINGISNSGAAATTTANINGNFFRGFSVVSTGQVAMIINTGAAGVAINMNNNHIGTATANAITYSAASSGNFFGLVNAGGAATATLSINGNDITKIVQNVTGSGGLNYINNQVFTGSVNINNNTYTNLTSNSTGGAIFISNNVTHAANTIQNVNNNSIVGTFNKTSTTGALQFYLSNSTSPTTVQEINTGNNFSNITVAGTGAINGWQSTDGATASPFGSSKTVTNNTFSNITGGTGAITLLNVAFSNAGSTNNISGNTISNITSGGAIVGINSAAGVQNFVSNTVNGLTVSGAASATGIQIQGGATQNISRNKLFDINGSNAGSTVNGISVTTVPTTLNVNNNFIADLKNTVASGTDVIRGISISAATAATTLNIFYNSINLNATSSGANFGTSGIFHTFNTTAANASLNLTNNIITNTSTANGTGLTVAFRRSAATNLNNYNTASNNNLFYAGTPSATNLIYSDGTNADQTLATYQTRVSTRDAASISEVPIFVSTTDLHLNPTANCAIDDKGKVVTVTTDIDSDTRNSSTPDIGADEFTSTFTLVVTNPAPVCAPTTVDITAIAVTAGSTVGATLSYWADALATTPIPPANGTPAAITASGTYFIRSINGTCSDIKPVTVAITTPASATIGYAGSPYCSNAGTATVTQTGTTGGTYSSTAGLSIDPTTGTITLGSSTPGTYTVTYGFAANGPCPASNFTNTVTITAAPSATISYASTPVCQNVGTANVTRTGTTGGTYSSSAGLTINATTGAVTTTSSTPGIYTVTYTILAAGGCATFTTTTTIEIKAIPAIASTIAEPTTCVSTNGAINLTMTGAAGPYTFVWTGPGVNTSAQNQTGLGVGNYSVTVTSFNSCSATASFTLVGPGGCNVCPTIPTLTSNPATQACSGSSVTITASGLTDMGVTYGIQFKDFATLPVDPYIGGTIIGTVANGALTGGGSTASISTNSLAVGNHIIFAILTPTPTSASCRPARSFTYTINPIPNATISYAASPYCQNAGTANVTRTGTAGGTYSSTAGLTINATTGAVTTTSSTPGTYTVTYTVAASGGCAVFTTTTSITITAPPTATIGYAGSPYCGTGTATVTRTGTAGGAYSSTAGITINATTGDVDLATSTPGTYTVTYTVAAAGGCAAFSTTASITISTTSVAPTGATTSVTANCDPAANVTLAVTGGTLGSGSSWKWYSGSCGGTLVGTGASITIPIAATTTYFVRAEGACNTTTCASVTVTINPQPTISLTAAPYTALMPGWSTTLTANVAPVVAGNTIIWYRNGSVVMGATGNTLAVTVDELGSYTARVTSPFTCTALSSELIIKDSATDKLFISPNPNNGQFKIRYYTNAQNFGFLRTVLIYDSKGAIVYNKRLPITAPYSAMDIDMRKNAKGLYTVRVADYQGKPLVDGKVVIQ